MECEEHVPSHVDVEMIPPVPPETFRLYFRHLYTHGSSLLGRCFAQVRPTTQELEKLWAAISSLKPIALNSPLGRLSKDVAVLLLPVTAIILSHWAIFLHGDSTGRRDKWEGEFRETETARFVKACANARRFLRRAQFHQRPYTRWRWRSTFCSSRRCHVAFVTAEVTPHGSLA